MAERPISQPAGRTGITMRAILIGLVGTPLNAYWLTYVYWHFGYLIDRPALIYYNCVCYLAGLAGVNALLRRWRPRWMFSAGELLTIYLLLSLATAWCGVDFLSDLPEGISNPYWFASPSNQWEELVLPYLPGWLTVSDTEVTSGLFEGYSTFYRWRMVRAWLGPVLWWTAMVTALMVAFVCVSSIFRRRWCDEDKLLFPAMAVPVQIGERRHGLFRNRAMWAGLALAAGLEVVNTAHGLRPAVPAISFYFDIGPYLQGIPPWNAIRQTGMELRPLGVAVCYLMPLDLIFSLWFFNLMFKAQIIAASHLGWTTNIYTGFPYVDSQGLGGFVALLASVLWLDRRYLGQVARKVLGLGSPLDDTDEAMSYRGAALGLAGAIVFLVYFFHRGGMGPPLTLFWAAVFLSLGLAATRIRAQLAPPTLELWWIGPNHVLPMVLGTKTMSRQAQGMMWLTYPITREFNSNPQPWTLEGFKLADAGQVDRRGMAWLMVAITPVAAMSVFWATLHVVYRAGVASNADPGADDHALDIPEMLASALQNPTGPDYALLGAVGVGVVATGILMALKLQFVSWPLHPVALPIACAWVTDEYLPAIFTAWVVKAAIMRYGGLRLHRQGLLFFVGVIIGSTTMSYLRTIVAWITNVPLLY